MSEKQPDVFEVDLEKQGQLRFKSPSELNVWNSEELSKWEWLNAAPMGRPILERHRNFHNQIPGFVEKWTAAINDKERREGALNHLKEIFKQYYIQKQILYRRSAEGQFILDLVQKRGGDVAAGAYYVIFKNYQFPSSITNPSILEGIIEGFLYDREIDWTATAHGELLNSLKKRYDEEIFRQDQRFQEIDRRNNELNEAFKFTLEKKRDSLTIFRRIRPRDLKK